MDTAKKEEKECEEKAWKFPVGSHEIVLRDQAASIMPDAVQFAPPYISH